MAERLRSRIPRPKAPGRSWMMTAGIVLVSIWMALWFGLSWLFLGLGSNYVCHESPCFERYDMWLLFVLLLQLLVIVGTIILWRRPRTRAWGLVGGFVLPGIPAVVFTIVWRVPL